MEPTASIEDLTIRNLSIKIANLEADNARLLATLQLMQQAEQEAQEEGAPDDVVEDPVQD